MTHCVSIENLSFDRKEQTIFSNLNLQVARGKITAIMGPSGSGKTTLLRLIGGQLKPTCGQIRVAGQEVNRLNSTQLYRLRRRMGILFQSGGLFTNLTVFDNIAFPLRELTTLPEPIIRDMVLMKLELVGLRGAVRLMPGQLSGGMARRVALARAIALDPELIMYDEPFTGLDPIALGVILKLIQDLKDVLSMTTILVSHDVEEVMRIADYVYLIAGGNVIAQGIPEALQTCNDSQVQQFLKGLPDGVVPFHYPAPAYEEDLFN